MAPRAAREAIRLDPNHYAAWANLGYAALELHLYRESESASREALRIRPGLQSAMTNLVVALRERGALDEAADLLAQCRARDASNKSFEKQLGEVRLAIATRDRVRLVDRLAVTAVAAAITVAVALYDGRIGLAVGVLALIATVIAWRVGRSKPAPPPALDP